MRLYLALLLLLPLQLDAADCQSLLQAEQRLAKAAGHNAAPAFLQALDPEAVMFLPALHPARPYWEQRAGPRQQLQWRAEVVGVSLAGDLGYTLGPFARRDAALELGGRYLSIWHGQSAHWRLLLDHGVAAHHPSATAPACRASAPASAGDDYAARIAAIKRAELQLELAGYQAQASLLYPRVTNQPQRCAGHIDRLRLARSGELAFTAGSATAGGSFVRIWRLDQDGRWQVEVELCADP